MIESICYRVRPSRYRVSVQKLFAIFNASSSIPAALAELSIAIELVS